MPRSTFAAVSCRELGGQPHLYHELNTKDLVQRLQLTKELAGHDGCVNTVHFNATGDLLVSGSDDCAIMLWDWAAGRQRLRYSSGHRGNVFQARTLPGTNDRAIVSCAADGQVRVGYLAEGSAAPRTLRLAQHDGRAHKLALDPQAPGSCFYSAGEDGEVLHFDLRRGDGGGGGNGASSSSGGGGSGGPVQRRLLLVRGYSAHGGASMRVAELNAIHCNPARPWQFLVCGSDEWVRVYDARRTGRGGGSDGAASAFQMGDEPVERLAPQGLRGGPGMQRVRQTHVTCAVFGRAGDVLATYNDDDVYLFAAGGHQQPLAAGRRRLEAAEGGRQSPATGNGCPEQGEEGAGSAGQGDGSGGDGRRLRQRRHAAAASAGPGPSSAAAAAAAAAGAPAAWDRVLRRFSGHRNSRTVKGCSFLGAGDEFVVSGSDCGHVYIWSNQEEEEEEEEGGAAPPHPGEPPPAAPLRAWLRGDRDVVNCLEPHPWLPLTLATSGIDDTVKVWEPTLAEPQPLPPEAARVMERNLADRGRRRYGISSEMLQRMFLAQHLPGGRGGGGSESGDEGDEESEDDREDEREEGEQGMGGEGAARGAQAGNGVGGGAARQPQAAAAAARRQERLAALRRLADMVVEEEEEDAPCRVA